MLVLRFVVGLGAGGVWRSAVALAAECWLNRSRPVVAGTIGEASTYHPIAYASCIALNAAWAGSL